MRVIQLGSVGSDVANWQNFLGTRDLSPGRSDGEFDIDTKTATESFQEEAGLEADGIVGRDTLAAAVALGFQPAPDISKTLEIKVPMDIDVDGAPNAYGPPGKPTLDFELNAHEGATSSGTIVGYIVIRGRPAIQQDGDPFPGYFISTTAFQDLKNPNSLDPRKYVDASKINYVVRAHIAEVNGVHLGDIVAVHSLRHNSSVFGIVGDTGHSSGAEGSLALLQALGFPFTSGKTGSVDEPDIIVRYFPGSNPDQHFFRDQAQIDSEANVLGLSKDFSAHH